jgi:hypothetical protein
MIRMTESAVEGLTQARAAELARVLELQAEWENLAAEPQDSTTRLQGVQRAFDVYRSRLLAYTGRENGQAIPELILNKSTRLRVWCRTVRAILLRAEGPAFPTHIMAKAQRVVGRLAARFAIEPAATAGATDLAGAIRQLDGVIAWCEALEQRPAHEVGAGHTSPA